MTSPPPPSRPLPVTIIAAIYIATGAVGFIYHFSDLTASGSLYRFDGIGIEAIRILAIIAGVFMLRAQNWARWLAIIWMAFHVVIGALNSVQQFAMHAAFLAVIAWLLLRPAANNYFKNTHATM